MLVEESTDLRHHANLLAASYGGDGELLGPERKVKDFDKRRNCQLGRFRGECVC